MSIAIQNTKFSRVKHRADSGAKAEDITLLYLHCQSGAKNRAEMHKLTIS